MPETNKHEDDEGSKEVPASQPPPSSKDTAKPKLYLSHENFSKIPLGSLSSTKALEVLNSFLAATKRQALSITPDDDKEKD